MDSLNQQPSDQNQPTTEQQQSIPPKNPISSKTLLVFIGVSIFTFFIVFTAYHLIRLRGIYQSLRTTTYVPVQPSPTPLPAKTSVKEGDPTANWKTYRNEKYGFELKYPPDWKVYDYLDEKGEQLQIIKLGPTQKERSLSWDDGASIVLFASETDGQEEEEKGELFSYNGWSGFRNIEIQENLKIDKITVSSKSPSGQTFFIMWEQTDPSNNDLTAEKFFMPILSTFKFTDQSPSATCIPRPACLDAVPRCLMPESENMCPPKPTGSQVVCTQDAKQCPDGSYVSRQPPTCEFAKCP